jgi:membrane-bound metal-dependent hydrolase YbcI (DUF457 family)
MVKPIARGLRARWIFLGAMLPDLIDKPLFYALKLWRGDPSPGDLITGSRSFGHTGLILIALALAAWGRHSRVLAAITLGVATHVLLDNVSERFISDDPQAVLALLWPYFDGRFPVLEARNATEHLWGHLLNPVILSGEALGLILLIREARRTGKRSR